MVRKIVRKLKGVVVKHSNIIGLSVITLFIVLSLIFNLPEMWGKPFYAFILTLLLVVVVSYMYVMMQVRLFVRSQRVIEEFMGMDLTPFFDNEPDSFYSMGEEWNKDA